MNVYANNNAALLHQYQSDSVMTAGPMDLIVMLYEALIKQIKLADIFLADQAYERVNQCLTKAQDIVSELLRSLDLRYPIAEELMQLYDFLLQELTQINMAKDRARIPDVLEIVGSLKDAFMQVRATGSRAFAIED